MNIDKKTIFATAKLASIEISEEEIYRYHKKFNNILNYMEKINQLDIKSVKPTSHIQDLETPLRKDEPSSTLSKEKALENHPHRKDSFFTVPKFIDQ